jgi:hypothetical protein
MKSFVKALKCTTKPIVRALLRIMDVTNIQDAACKQDTNIGNILSNIENCKAATC